MALMNDTSASNSSGLDPIVFKTEKASWYREVLDVEPGSKIFLPYARLLSELDRPADAVQVLQNGLMYHPEFTEARLFLINLLHKSGEASRCGAEVARLAGLFCEFPDFWEAWSEFSAEQGASKDFTVSLGILGAIIRDKRVSIVDVLASGLNALRARHGSPVPPDPRSADTAPAASFASSSCLSSSQSPQPSGSPLSGIIPGEDFGEENLHTSEIPTGTSTPPDLSAGLQDESISSSAPVAGPITDFATVEPAPAESAGIPLMAEAEYAAAPSLVAEELEDEVECVPDGEEVDIFEAGSDTVPFVFGADGDFVEDVPRDTLPPLSLDPDVIGQEALDPYAEAEEETEDNSALLASEPIIDPESDGSDTIAFEVADDTAPIEEKCSLRTRSMAEVLAEQGDVRGAINIYEELLAVASPDDAGDLEMRLNSLKARTNDEGTATVRTASASSQPKTVPHSENKGSAGNGVLDLLERLAVRLENKAQQ